MSSTATSAATSKGSLLHHKITTIVIEEDTAAIATDVLTPAIYYTPSTSSPSTSCSSSSDQIAFDDVDDVDEAVEVVAEGQSVNTSRARRSTSSGIGSYALPMLNK